MRWGVPMVPMFDDHRAGAYGRPSRLPAHRLPRRILNSLGQPLIFERNSSQMLLNTDGCGLLCQRSDASSVFAIVLLRHGWNNRRIHKRNGNHPSTDGQVRSRPVSLRNGDLLDHAQQMAVHQCTRTTKLYDRRSDEITLDEVARIVL
jgi:hypothetical protein